MMADGSILAGGIVPDAAKARLFRDALGRFATGVTVITILGPDGPMGFTANSFSSLSLDPPLVLWSPAKSSSRFAPFAAAEHYAIHVLGQAQADWPPRFSRGGAGFEGLHWQTNKEGVPVLPGVLARFDCRRHAEHEGGDHVIIVGRVLRLAVEDGEPLIFTKGRFGGFVG
jgi:flavin reductase (DIM6/NTAB) family NADH-FMN oxidoreductase RutF